MRHDQKPLPRRQLKVTGRLPNCLELAEVQGKGDMEVPQLIKLIHISPAADPHSLLSLILPI
ncbi:hypothetical protein AAY473_038792 [Plecturocebus cupreus]